MIVCGGRARDLGHLKSPPPVYPQKGPGKAELKAPPSPAPFHNLKGLGEGVGEGVRACGP